MVARADINMFVMVESHVANNVPLIYFKWFYLLQTIDNCHEFSAPFLTDEITFVSCC